jgi:hypothetical protein
MVVLMVVDQCDRPQSSDGLLLEGIFENRNLFSTSSHTPHARKKLMPTNSKQIITQAVTSPNYLHYSVACQRAIYSQFVQDEATSAPHFLVGDSIRFMPLLSTTTAAGGTTRLVFSVASR